MSGWFMTARPSSAREGVFSEALFRAFVTPSRWPRLYRIRFLHSHQEKRNQGPYRVSSRSALLWMDSGFPFGPTGVIEMAAGSAANTGRVISWMRSMPARALHQSREQIQRVRVQRVCTGTLLVAVEYPDLSGARYRAWDGRPSGTRVALGGAVLRLDIRHYASGRFVPGCAQWVWLLATSADKEQEDTGQSARRGWA